jgi:hypothetical protein
MVRGTNSCNFWPLEVLCWFRDTKYLDETYGRPPDSSRIEQSEPSAGADGRDGVFDRYRRRSLDGCHCRVARTFKVPADEEFRRVIRRAHPRRNSHSKRAAGSAG